MDSFSPPKEEVIKVIKEPSALSLFLKENLKLLIFSSFLFIGLVWLFVYVTNLTSYSEEIRIATGFVISIALFLINYIKKFDGNKATSFILSSYITGLLSLLFGSVVLDVIPQTVAIVISLIYISFGLSYVNK